MEEIMEYLSKNIRIELEQELRQEQQDVEEIRIRLNKPIVLKITLNQNSQIRILNYIVTMEDMQETFSRICENSVYSYKKQICEGFITIRGGHRVGIVGNCVIENGQVINIAYISSLNFRVAKEKINCSLNLMKYIINMQNKTIYNTLIASKPGGRKDYNVERYY